MHRKSFSNFIIISGSGKKVGKTHLAVALIRNFSQQSQLLALKISPHQHDRLGKVTMVSERQGYRLFRESESHAKNSGQFLLAGASSAYFLETEDGSLSKAIAEFNDICNPSDLPVVCESGALGKIIEPGIMVYIDDPDSGFDDYKESVKRLADVILPARQFSASDFINTVHLVDRYWERVLEF